MKIETYGNLNLKVKIDVYDFIKKLKNELGFKEGFSDSFFLVDNKLYVEAEYSAGHGSYFEKQLFSEDEKIVELYKAINTLEEYLKSK